MAPSSPWIPAPLGGHRSCSLPHSQPQAGWRRAHGKEHFIKYHPLLRDCREREQQRVWPSREGHYLIYNLNKAQDSCNAPRIKSKGTRLLELIGRDIFLRMLLLRRLLLLSWRREAQAGLGELWHPPASSSRMQPWRARLVPTEQPWEYRWQQRQSHLQLYQDGFGEMLWACWDAAAPVWGARRREDNN